LADLWLRAETERGPVAVARLERSAQCDAAAGSYQPAATHAKADEEALSKTGIRP
jgi:hypothetical protein